MKYMLIHTIDPNTEHGTDDMPDFDSWLQEMLARGVTLHGDRPHSHRYRRPYNRHASKAHSIGLPQRASTPRKSRIAGNTSLFQSVPCES